MQRLFLLIGIADMNSAGTGHFSFCFRSVFPISVLDKSNIGVYTPII
jgi:hypothetical protein